MTGEERAKFGYNGYDARIALEHAKAYADSKNKMTAWISSCGCNSTGNLCQYHKGMKDGYKDGISEKIQDRDFLMGFLYIGTGFFLGVAVYAMYNAL